MRDAARGAPAPPGGALSWGGSPGDIGRARRPPGGVVTRRSRPVSPQQMQARPAPAAITVSPTSASPIATISPLMMATAPVAPAAWTHRAHASTAAVRRDGAIITRDSTPDGSRTGHWPHPRARSRALGPVGRYQARPVAGGPPALDRPGHPDARRATAARAGTHICRAPMARRSAPPRTRDEVGYGATSARRRARIVGVRSADQEGGRSR